MQTIYVLANNIRSLYNIGALFRLCDGVGVEKLFLCGITGAPFDDVKHARQRQQIAKTALEGLNSVTWEYHPDPVKLIDMLKQQGVQIVALEQAPNSIPLNQAQFRSPVCLILGHETEGIESRVLDASDLIAEIPMRGRGKSHNVISSAAMALYEMNGRKPEASLRNPTIE